MFNTDLLEAVELGFLLDIAETVVVGALNREESRGGHFREDFPDRDDKNYMRHTMAYRRPLPAEGHRLWGTEGDGDHKGSFAHTDGVRRLPARAGLQARHDDPLPADGA